VGIEICGFAGFQGGGVTEKPALPPAIPKSKICRLIYSPNDSGVVRKLSLQVK
jgi:hypothetical protein